MVKISKFAVTFQWQMQCEQTLLFHGSIQSDVELEVVDLAENILSRISISSVLIDALFGDSSCDFELHLLNLLPLLFAGSLGMRRVRRRSRRRRNIRDIGTRLGALRRAR